MADSDIKLVYFAVRAKTESMRMMLEYKKIAYQQVSVQEHFGKGWGLGAKAEAVFNKLPLLVTNGATIAQSGTITRYLANVAGLVPSDAIQAAQCDAVFEQGQDMGAINPIVNVFKGDTYTFKYSTYFAETFQTTVPPLVRFLADKKFFLGDEPYYCDFGVFHMVDNILTANAAAFDAYPTMKAFHARVAALDGVKEYMARRPVAVDVGVAPMLKPVGESGAVAAPVKKPVKAVAPFDPNKWAEEPKKMPKEVQEAYRTYSDDGSFGKDAPALDTLEWIKGDAVAYSSEKPTVVVFWAKFAKGDYTTIVGVSDIYDDFKEQAQFIGISLDPVVDDAKSFLKKIGTAMPELDVKKCVVPYSLAFDTGKTVKEAFRTTSELMSLTASACFIIDAKGKILWREQFGQGYAPKKGQLREQLRRHCAGEGLLSNGKKPVVEDSDEDLADGDMDCDYDSDLGF